MHPFAMKNVAACAVFIRATSVFGSILVFLAGCAGGPKAAPTPERFDLGAAAPVAVAPAQAGVPVWLASVHAPSSLDGTHMLYRLDYSNSLQSRAYAQARWSMPLPELLEQRLRQRLSQNHAVLNPADGVQSRQQGVILRVELEEFSQSFSAPDKATAQVRVRATLSGMRSGAEHLLSQRTFQAEQPCASADAPGGVRALSAATAQLLGDLERWLDAAALR